MIFDYEPFVGCSIQSILALVDDQDVKNHLLWYAISQIYRVTQPIVLPYPLPFGQAHCLCCKWSYPCSSARAAVSSRRATFTTYIKIGDRPAPSDMRYFLVDNDWHPTGPVRSSVVTIRPGWESIYCGLFTAHDSRVLRSMLFLTLPSRHANYVQCKPTVLIISVCRR
jgi:hypothetical protein